MLRCIMILFGWIQQSRVAWDGVPRAVNIQIVFRKKINKIFNTQEAVSWMIEIALQTRTDETQN